MQLNIGHVNGMWAACASLFARMLCASTARLIVACIAADGVYTGEWTTMALCGFIRGMGEGDAALDRLWTKQYEESKAAI